MQTGFYTALEKNVDELIQERIDEINAYQLSIVAKCQAKVSSPLHKNYALPVASEKGEDNSCIEP